MGEDGFLHCSICHEPVQMKAPEECRSIFPSGIMDKHCRCVRERIARDEAERKRRKAEERIAELQRICFTDPAYMRHTFEQDKGYSPAARKVAEWYVDTYHDRRANNEGLMFMGDTGTGKRILFLFWTNSIFIATPIAEASRLSVLTDGFPLPLSSLLISPCEMPVLSESSF